MTSRSTPRRIVLCEIQEVLTSLRLNERFAVGGSSLDRHGGSNSSLSGSGGSSNVSGSGGGGGASGSDGGGVGGGAPLSAEIWREPPLVANLKALRVACRACDDRGFMAMSALDLVLPFLEVIKSEETSGDVTGAALGALASLLQGGILDPPPPRPSSLWQPSSDERNEKSAAGGGSARGGTGKAKTTRKGNASRTRSPRPPPPTRPDLSAALSDVVEAVSSCRFEFTDAQRDEVVVAQVIGVLKLCAMGPRGRLLPDERVWDIVQDGFAHRNTLIHSQALCHVAEEALLCVVRQVFRRFHHHLNNDSQSNVHSNTLSLGSSRGAPGVGSSYHDDNQHSQLHHHHQQPQLPHHGFGLPVAVKLFGFLCAQLQKGPTSNAAGLHNGNYSSAALAGGGAEALQGLVNRDATRRLCLKMVRIALEETCSSDAEASSSGGGGGARGNSNDSGNGGSNISSASNASSGGNVGSSAITECPAIQALIRDDLCAALLWMGQGGQPHLVSPPTLVEALAVVRLLWGKPLRVFLKVQLEALFLGVFLRQLKHLSQVAEWHSSDSSVDLVGVLNGDSSDGSGNSGNSGQGKGRRAASSTSTTASNHHKSLLSLHEDGSAPCSNVELEAILECLGDLMAEPALVVDLFVNFDCDLARADVLEATVALLAFCARSPAPALQGGARALCMEALLNGLKALNSRCSSVAPRSSGGGTSASGASGAASEGGGEPATASNEEERGSDKEGEEGKGRVGVGSEEGSSSKGPTSSSSSPPHGQQTSFASHPLWQRKLRKRILRQGALLFNQKPRSGFIALQEANLLPKPLTPEAAVKFLRTAPGLDKAVVGSYLGESGKSGKEAEGVHEADTATFHAAVLVAFGNSFDFKGQPLVAALRMFLSAFRLPGEAQQIDRVIQAFADAAFEHCVDATNGSLPTPDAVYLLAFSIILLHTDVHNPNIASEKKMTVDAFVKNNTNYGVEICKGRDLPRDLLESVYDAISSEEFETHASQEAPTNSGSSGSYSDGVPAVTLGLNTAISSARWRDLLKSVEKDPLAGLLLCPIGTDYDDDADSGDAYSDDDDDDDGDGSGTDRDHGDEDNEDKGGAGGGIEPLDTTDLTASDAAANSFGGMEIQDTSHAPLMPSSESLNSALQSRMLRVPSEFPGHLGSAAGEPLSLESAKGENDRAGAGTAQADAAATTEASAAAAAPPPSASASTTTPATTTAPLHVSEVDPMVLHLLWKPVLEAAAGLFLLGKAAGEHASPSALRQAVDATLVLAKLAARHELQAVFDTLVYVLASFTGLLAPWPTSSHDKYAFGSGSTSNSSQSGQQQQQSMLEVPSVTAQVIMLRNLVTSPASRMAAVAVFGVAHRLGAHLKAAWQPVVRLVFRLRDLQLLDSSLLLTESDEDFLPSHERHYYTHLRLDKAQARRSASASSDQHPNQAGDVDRSGDQNNNNNSNKSGSGGGGGILGWFFGAASAPAPAPSNRRRLQRRRRHQSPSSSSFESEGAHRNNNSRSNGGRVPRCEMWNDGAHAGEGNGDGSRNFSSELGAPLERSHLSEADEGYGVWSDNSGDDENGDDDVGGTAGDGDGAVDRSSFSTDDEEGAYGNFYDDDDDEDDNGTTKADKSDGTHRSSLGQSWNSLPGEGRWNDPAHDPELAALLSERQQLRSVAKEQFAACQVGELIHDCRELSDASLWAFLHALTAAVHAHLPSDERRAPPSVSGATTSSSSTFADSRGSVGGTAAPASETSTVKTSALPLLDEGIGLLPLDLLTEGAAGAEAGKGAAAPSSSEALAEIEPVDRPNMYLPPLSPPSLVFAEVLVTEIALRNRDRLTVVWPLLSAHYRKRLSGASHASLGVEKAANGLLRLCCRAGGRPRLAPLLLSDALAWLLPPSPPSGCPPSLFALDDDDALCRPRVHQTLLPLIGSALLRCVRLHASGLQSLPTPQHWAPLLALLASCAAANYHQRRHHNRRREHRSREGEGKAGDASNLKLTDFLCAEAVLAQSGRLRAFKALTSIVQDHRLFPISSTSSTTSSGLSILSAAQCCASFWDTSRAIHVDLNFALRQARNGGDGRQAADTANNSTAVGAAGGDRTGIPLIASIENDDRNTGKSRNTGGHSSSSAMSSSVGLYVGSTQSRVAALESSLTALAKGAAGLLAILLQHLTKSLILSSPAALPPKESSNDRSTSTEKGAEVQGNSEDRSMQIQPNAVVLNDWYTVLAMFCRICGGEASRPSVRAHALHVLRSVLLEDQDSLPSSSSSSPSSTPALSTTMALFQKAHPGIMHRAIATLQVPLTGLCRDARVSASKETALGAYQSKSEKHQNSSNYRSSSNSGGNRRRRVSGSGDDDDDGYGEGNMSLDENGAAAVPGTFVPGPRGNGSPEAATRVGEGGGGGALMIGGVGTGERHVITEFLSPHKCAHLAPLLDDATTAEAVALELLCKSFLRHLTSLHPLHLPGASTSSFVASDPPFHELWLQVLGALQRCLLPKHPPRPPPPPIPSNNSSSRGGDYSPRALAARALAAKSAALTSPQHAQVQVRGPSRSQEPSHEASSSSSSFGVVEPFSMNPLQTTSDFHPILSFSSSSYPAAHALHWIAVEYLKALLLSLAELGAFTPGNHTVGRELWEFTWTVLMHAPDHNDGGGSGAEAGVGASPVNGHDSSSHHSNPQGSARSNRIGSNNSNRSGRTTGSGSGGGHSDLGDHSGSSGSGNVAASVLRSLFPDHDFHHPPSPTLASALPPLPPAPPAAAEGIASAGASANEASAATAADADAEASAAAAVVVASSDASRVGHPLSRNAAAMRALAMQLPEELLVLLVEL